MLKPDWGRIGAVGQNLEPGLLARRMKHDDRRDGSLGLNLWLVRIIEKGAGF